MMGTCPRCFTKGTHVCLSGSALLTGASLGCPVLLIQRGAWIKRGGHEVDTTSTPTSKENLEMTSQCQMRSQPQASAL